MDVVLKKLHQSVDGLSPRKTRLFKGEVRKVII